MRTDLLVSGYGGMMLLRGHITHESPRVSDNVDKQVSKSGAAGTSPDPASFLECDVVSPLIMFSVPGDDASFILFSSH